jgi:hypothetical protein
MVLTAHLVGRVSKESVRDTPQMSDSDRQAARIAQCILQNTTDGCTSRVPQKSEGGLCDLLTESRTKQSKSLRIRGSTRINVRRTRSRSWSPPKVRDPLSTRNKRSEESRTSIEMPRGRDATGEHANQYATNRGEHPALQITPPNRERSEESKRYSGETEWSDANTVELSPAAELTSFRASPEHKPAQNRWGRTSPLAIIQKAKDWLFYWPTVSETRSNRTQQTHAEIPKQVGPMDESTFISVDAAMGILLRTEEKIRQERERKKSLRLGGSGKAKRFWF